MMLYLYDFLTNILQGGQDEFLIVTFVGETRAFHMAENGILREYNFTRMVTGSQSLYCGNVIDDQIVQITVEGVFLLHAQSGILIHQWNPPNGREVIYTDSRRLGLVCIA